MEWLLERIVGGRLVGRDETERGAPREQRAQYLVAQRRVALEQRRRSPVSRA